jgi:predicted nucleic acid-binding protein
VIVVVDASVAIKWFVSTQPDEAHADLALKILERSVLGAVEMVQPPHFIAEVAAVLSRLKPHDVQEDLLDLLQIEFRTLDTPATYAKATALAVKLRHHLFDTLYHAVALTTPGATLVTADQQYFARARSEGGIVLLSQFSPA